MSNNLELPKYWELKKLGEARHPTSEGTSNRGNSKYYEGNSLDISGHWKCLPLSRLEVGIRLEPSSKTQTGIIL